MKNLRALSIITIISSMLCSCGAFGEFATGVTSAYVSYVETSGNDPFGAYDLAQSYNKGNIDKGLATAEMGLLVADALTDKDLSNATEVIRGTRTFLLNDSNASNDKAKYIAAAFQVTGYIVGQYEEKEWGKEIDAFYEMNEKYTDPNSPSYDPYFSFRYEIDYENKRIRKKETSEVLKEIRNYETNNQQQKNINDLVQYGIISDQEEYNYYFGTKERMEENKELYLEYLAKLRDIRLSQYYSGIYESNDPYSTSADVATETLNNTSSPNNTTTQNDEMLQIEYKKNMAINIIESTIINEYKFDSANLSDEQKKQLDNIAQLLINEKHLKIKIAGHTCNIGSDKANYNVGLKRAEEAKEYLIISGIEECRIETESMGASNPFVDNNSNDNRLHNRRITFTVVQ